MNPLTALGVIAALLVVAAVVGAVLARRGGRVRRLQPTQAVDPADFGAHEFGAGGTIIQFSTAYCTRCPSVRRLISQTVESRPGLDFIHVDVTDRPELASRYRLTQTPTVLILDGSGTPRGRLAGTFSRATLSDGIESTIGSAA